MTVSNLDHPYTLEVEDFLTLRLGLYHVHRRPTAMATDGHIDQHGRIDAYWTEQLEASGSD